MPQDPNPSRNPDYYSVRSTEERRLAMATTDAKARAIHLEMAERYAALARGVGEATHPTGEPQTIG
jgi:hypothetical protein